MQELAAKIIVYKTVVGGIIAVGGVIYLLMLYFLDAKS